MLKIVIALVVFAFCAAVSVKEQAERNNHLVEFSEIALGLFLSWAVMAWAL